MGDETCIAVQDFSGRTLPRQRAHLMQLRVCCCCHRSCCCCCCCCCCFVVICAVCRTYVDVRLWVFSRCVVLLFVVFHGIVQYFDYIDCYCDCIVVLEQFLLQCHVFLLRSWQRVCLRPPRLSGHLVMAVFAGQAHWARCGRRTRALVAWPQRRAVARCRGECVHCRLL